MQNLDALYDHTKQQFDNYSHVAHGFDHVYRVAKLARYIAEQEGYDDPSAAEAAGLLHDIGRTVQEEADNHGPAGVPKAEEFLKAYTGFDDSIRADMLRAIHDHSEFKADGALTHIVMDADKLDGLGAVGLMRSYTSKWKLPAYDPDNIIPTEGKRDTFIHDQVAFQLEWVDMMETATGKAIADKRAAFTHQFLQQFASEVQAQDLS